MRIVVAGGTGLIGSALARRLVAEGHEVNILTRGIHSGDLNAGFKVTVWNGSGTGPWVEVIDGCDVVINLAGHSIGSRRWTRAEKARIVGSRLDATRALVSAIRRSGRPPGVLLNASAVGYYGHVESGEVSECSPRGEGFLAVTTDQWEQEALRATESGTRVVLLRLGIVLARAGGVLKRMLVPFRMFVGGTPGSGRQWVSWVHRDDAVGAILHLLGDPTLVGPVNLVSPEACRMKDFCTGIAAAVGRPSWIPVPSGVIRLALGEMAEVVLAGQRVRPSRLLQSGYDFRFPTLAAAMADVVGGSKRRN